LKSNPVIRDVQTFGDRLNVIVVNAKNDFGSIETMLASNNIHIESFRTVNPSLENVFISLMTKQDSNISGAA
jgi:ABC-2 type transport system ATP-binding protein